MDTFFNSMNYFAQDALPSVKADFSSKYGTRGKYTLLDDFGNLQATWQIITLVVLIFVILITNEKRKPEIDPQTKQPKEMTTVNKIANGVFWLAIFSGVFVFGYTLYIYIFIYLKQYYEWFNSLPEEAKRQLVLIKQLESTRKRRNRL